MFCLLSLPGSAAQVAPAWDKCLGHQSGPAWICAPVFFLASVSPAVYSPPSSRNQRGDNLSEGQLRNSLIQTGEYQESTSERVSEGRAYNIPTPLTSAPSPTGGSLCDQGGPNQDLAGERKGEERGGELGSREWVRVR